MLNDFRHLLITLFAQNAENFRLRELDYSLHLTIKIQGVSTGGKGGLKAPKF